MFTSFQQLGYANDATQGWIACTGTILINKQHVVSITEGHLPNSLCISMVNGMDYTVFCVWENLPGSWMN